MDIAKITPAVNWPGLAYSAQQFAKNQGGPGPCAPPLSYPMMLNYSIMSVQYTKNLEHFDLYNHASCLHNLISKNNLTGFRRV